MNGNPLQNANIQPIDLHNTLTAARVEDAGMSNDWENEIHPTAGGYVKLASTFVSKLSPHLA